MKEKEKILIDNLFNKILKMYNKELKSDINIENFINKKIIKFPKSPYYMVQMILVQDMVIKELNNIISKLKKNIYINKNESNFLSNEVKKNILSNNIKNINHHHDNNTIADNFNMTDKINVNKNNLLGNNQSGVSNFLSNALQTMTGVAGGMVVGNIITNLLHLNQTENHKLDNLDSNNIESNIDNSINNNFFDSNTSDRNISDNIDDIYNDNFDDESDNVDDFDDNIL